MRLATFSSSIPVSSIGSRTRWRPTRVPRIQTLARIADGETDETFNMGMGFAIVAPEGEAKGIVRDLRPLAAKVVGEVVRGEGVTVPGKGLSYTRY